MRIIKMSDSIEKELYQIFINAEYNYLKFLREKEYCKFIDETKNYILDDTHWAYKIWHQEKEDNKIINDSDLNEIKELYYNLSKIVHPDKCTEFWGNDMFIIISDAYNNNDSEKLIEISNYWKKNNTFDFYIDYNFKVTQITTFKHEAWYDWFHNPNSSLRQVLIPMDKYLQKLKDENKN